MGRSSAPTPQVTQTNTAPPAWYQEGSQRALAQAEGIAGQPVNVFQGPRVAGFAPDQLAAMDRARGLQGVGAAQIAPARDVFTGVSQFQPAQVNTRFAPQQVQAQNFLQADLQGYLNPQTDNIERIAMDNIDRQRQVNLNAVQDAAIRAGAFGGSRLGVREGVADAEAARAAGETSAQLRSQAFDRATALIQADQGRALQAGGMNQSADLNAQQLALNAETANQSALAQGAGIRLAGGNALLDATNRERALTAQEISMLDASGIQQQNLDQSRLDADQARFTEGRDWELRGLNARLAALGQIQPGSNSTQTQSGGGVRGDRTMQTVGQVAQIAGAAAMMFSDDTLKTDITRIGKTEIPNVFLYAFRYKGDPKTYPKVPGLLASEVEKEVPEAVKKLGGKRVIDAGFLKKVMDGVES